MLKAHLKDIPLLGAHKTNLKRLMNILSVQSSAFFLSIQTGFFLARCALELPEMAWNRPKIAWKLPKIAGKLPQRPQIAQAQARSGRLLQF